MKANDIGDEWTDELSSAMRIFIALTLYVVLTLGGAVSDRLALRWDPPEVACGDTRNRSLEFLSSQVNRFLSTGVHAMLAQRKADRLEWEELVRRLKTRGES